MKTIPRNPYALAAKMRRVSIFHDRRDPRGGAKNMQEEYLKDWNYTTPTWFEDMVDLFWDNKTNISAVSLYDIYYELIDLGLGDISLSVANKLFNNKSMLIACNSHKELLDNLAELLRDYIL